MDFDTLIHTHTKYLHNKHSIKEAAPGKSLPAHWVLFFASRHGLNWLQHSFAYSLPIFLNAVIYRTWKHTEKY